MLENYATRTWTTDDGLVNNIVVAASRDERGFLWLGTTGGLCRFDGDQFKEVLLPARYSPGGQSIRAMVSEDPRTLLLLPTSGEVVRWRDGVATLHPVSALLAGRQPVEIFIEPGGALWVTLLDGSMLRWEAGHSRSFGASEGFSRRTGRVTFALDHNGKTWVATGRFLGRYEDDRLVPVNVGIEEPMVIASGRAGSIWICTPTRLLRLSRGEIETHLIDAPWRQAFATLQCQFEDRHGTLWLASGRLGLYTWAAGQLSLIKTPYPIVLFLNEDREGNLWVGTSGSGLGQLKNRAYRLFNIKTGLGEDASNAVFSDNAGQIFLANNSGGIMRLGQNDRPLPLNLTRRGEPLYLSTGCFDLEGNLWCGGHDGLFRAKPPFTDEPEKLPAPESNMHLLYRSSDATIWFAASPSQFGCYRHGQSRLFTAADGYSGQTVRSIVEDHEGHVWAGTFSGELYRIDGDRCTRVLPARGLAEQPIHDLLVDRSGAFWIATARGLLLLQEDGTFKPFTSKDGLPDELISRLLEDARGNLWFESRSGLYFAPRAQFLAVARGQSTRIVSQRFGKEQGLVGLAPRINYFPSALRGRDGRLWFATSQGVVAVDPNLLDTDLPPPPVFIDEILVDDRPVPIAASLAIPSGQHRIEFRFSALSFASVESIHLRHQLEGADPGWFETHKNRSASYSGLAPGTYRMRVTAANGFGPWHEPGATLSFRVLPAWWQNPWWLAAALLLLCILLALAVHHWSQRQLKMRILRLEQEQTLERERTRIARDLHDDLGGSLVETGLLVERLRHTVAAELPAGLATLASHTRRLNVELASIVWTVASKDASLPRLTAFLRRYALRIFQQSSVTCTVHESTPIPDLPLGPDAQHHLLAVTKEALTNILKHAHASHVNLEFGFIERCFRIAITDDGVGFAPVAPDDESGNGLRNMRTRLAELGGNVSVESNPGAGTRVLISVRCPPSSLSSRAPA